jgi:peptidoglycan-N-acetylglucosamine deacetylase
MRGRAILISLASLAVAIALGGGGALPSVAPLASAGAAPVVLPTGCTHGGRDFRTHGPSHKKRIAIGFDDGPSDYTPQVLSALRRFGAHATFFEIGQETAGRAAVMRSILAQGNEIGNHTLHHEQNASTQSLAETDRLVHNATGFRPCDFRPPDGAVNQGLIERAHAERLVTVTWDVDPRDWSDPGVAAIASNVIHNAHDGSIVVMHDGGGDRSETVAALPQILSHFQHRGYQFVPIEQLLGHHFIYPAAP